MVIGFATPALFVYPVILPHSTPLLQWGEAGAPSASSLRVILVHSSYRLSTHPLVTMGAHVRSRSTETRPWHTVRYIVMGYTQYHPWGFPE